MNEALGRGKLVEKFLKGTSAPPPCKRSGRPYEDLVAITVRVPKRIADRLIDACAARRKNRQRPWSQQGIAAEALEEWLNLDQNTE